MPWQDIGFMLGGIVFFLTLLPTLLDEESAVPRTTSVPTAATLWLFTILYVSMGFWLSVIVNALTAAVWSLIAVFKST